MFSKSREERVGVQDREDIPIQQQCYVMVRRRLEELV